MIAAIIGGIGTFLPWAQVPFLGTVNGTEGDGWITLGLFAVPLILALTGESQVSLKRTKLIFASVASFIAAIIGFIDLNDITSITGGNDMISQMMGDMVSVGSGLYVIIIAGIALPILAFALKGSDIPTEPNPFDPQ
jgi:hypothetical protein